LASHSISVSQHKPTSLRYNKQLQAAVNIIKNVGGAPTDPLIYHFMQTSRLAESISQAFGYADGWDGADMDPDRIQAVVRSFEGELESIRNACPPEGWDNGEWPIL